MISEAAVEAALSALNRSRGLNLDDQARAALEAAAPHMTREAKRDGWDEGWQKAHATEDPAMAGIFFNPFRSQA